jgi:hypothetical protein
VQDEARVRPPGERVGPADRAGRGQPCGASAAAGGGSGRRWGPGSPAGSRRPGPPGALGRRAGRAGGGAGRRARVARLRRRARRRAEDQPGGPTRRARASWGLRHRGSRVSAAPWPGGQRGRRAPAAAIPGHPPIRAPNARAPAPPEARRAVATAALPPGEERGRVRLEEAAVTALPRRARGRRGAVEGARPGTAPAPHRRRQRLPRPALRLSGPALVLRRPPWGPSRAGQAGCRGGRRGRGARPRGEAGAGGRGGGVGPPRGPGDALGREPRARWGVSPEPGGPPLRQRVPPRTAVGDLAGEGGPKARRCRVRRRAIPPVHRAPGRRRPPRRPRRGGPVGEEGQRLPPFQGHEAGAIGLAPPPRARGHAAALRGDHGRAGRAAAHAAEGGPPPRAAAVPAPPPAGRAPQGATEGEEAGGPPSGAARPGRHQARPSCRHAGARAGRMTTAARADPAPPRPPGTTAREIGQRPAVATMAVPGWGSPGWASSCRLGGRTPQGHQGLRCIDRPGLAVKRDQLGPPLGQRVSHLPGGPRANVVPQPSLTRPP